MSGRFCPGWLLSVPVLSEYICYNRKLNITLNFMFRMYDKKIISVTSHALCPPPPVTNCHTISDPSPSSVTYFMDGPFTVFIQIQEERSRSKSKPCEKKSTSARLIKDLMYMYQSHKPHHVYTETTALTSHPCPYCIQYLSPQVSYPLWNLSIIHVIRDYAMLCFQI